ncbi:MAG: hypothetical protein KAS88_05545 [Deltaproteobacteria bacterium]|nr:hypothetical protein [Deltaproteobacteria bacterium]
MLFEYFEEIFCAAATIGVFYLYLSTRGIVWKSRKFESEIHRKKAALTYILLTLWGGGFFILMILGVI